jgi:uncharacterized repeat protein (TIGR03943 family)
MRFRQFMERWQGIFLCLVGSVAALWLGATKHLNLYIHPRYITFTVILALIATIISIISFKHHYEPDVAKKSKYQIPINVGIVILCVAALVGLLAIKPATLTTSTVNQRGINSSITTGIKTTNAVPLFGGGNFDNFTIKDWSSLLVQTNDLSFYKGKSVNITGFVSPDPDDAQNVFFVSRFVLTCCAVDARPIGVPVYAPNWQAQYKADNWVIVKGGFIANPSAQSQQRVVVKPDSIAATTQPKVPYVY